MNDYNLIFYDQDGINIALTEEEEIIESVKRILMTPRGSRVNNLGFGSDIMKYIFLPEMSIDDLTEEIRRSIARHETRVDVLSVTYSRSINQDDIISINIKLLIKDSKKIVDYGMEI